MPQAEGKPSYCIITFSVSVCLKESFLRSPFLKRIPTRVASGCERFGIWNYQQTLIQFTFYLKKMWIFCRGPEQNCCCVMTYLSVLWTPELKSSPGGKRWFWRSTIPLRCRGWYMPSHCVRDFRPKLGLMIVSVCAIKTRLGGMNDEGDYIIYISIDLQQKMCIWVIQ